MAEDSGDKTLIKIAMFCIAMSIMTTCLLSLYVTGSPEYSYDTINGYRSDLSTFSGGQLINDNPWVLEGVYTPFVPSAVATEDIPDHIQRDGDRTTGWLYGEKVTTYQYLGMVADIKLDPNQKSNQLLTVGDPFSWQYKNGKEWWAGGNDAGVDLSGVGRFFMKIFNPDQDTSEYGTTYSTGTADNWMYSGYRYTFNPVLPFTSEGSTKDGQLSMVWYQTGNNESGLSGALEVYADKDHEQVKLGTISAADIISTFYRSSEGYVHVFDFNFEGTHLNLTIRFDPTVYNTYNSLQNAWDAGSWSLAVSSVSAGNFFDVENSNSFNVTAGSMLDTFIQIYTFEYPHFEDSWTEVIMWLLVGLPMTLAMLFITMRLVGGVFKIF